MVFRLLLEACSHTTLNQKSNTLYLAQEYPLLAGLAAPAEEDMSTAIPSKPPRLTAKGLTCTTLPFSNPKSTTSSPPTHANYNPLPKLFFGEDQYLKRYVLRTGYKWRVLPFLGATHLGTSKNYVTIGISYRRYGHFGVYKLARRMVARFVFTPFAALINLSVVTFWYLTKLNVEFLAGFVKELILEKL